MVNCSGHKCVRNSNEVTFRIESALFRILFDKCGIVFVFFIAPSLSYEKILVRLEDNVFCTLNRYIFTSTCVMLNGLCGKIVNKCYCFYICS